MKFTELSSHLHDLRFNKTRKSRGYRMNADEVWSCVHDCPKNGIDQVYIRQENMPLAAFGLFTRMAPRSGEGGDIVGVYVNQKLPTHLCEFVIIKELVHSWSPESTRVSNPAHAQALVSAMHGLDSQFTAFVLGDQQGVVAALEVMLPLYIVEQEIASGLDLQECALRHNLDPHIASLIYSPHTFEMRRTGSL